MLRYVRGESGKVVVDSDTNNGYAIPHNQWKQHKKIELESKLQKGTRPPILLYLFAWLPTAVALSWTASYQLDWQTKSIVLANIVWAIISYIAVTSHQVRTHEECWSFVEGDVIPIVKARIQDFLEQQQLETEFERQQQETHSKATIVQTPQAFYEAQVQFYRQSNDRWVAAYVELQGEYDALVAWCRDKGVVRQLPTAAELKQENNAEIAAKEKHLRDGYQEERRATA